VTDEYEIVLVDEVEVGDSVRSDDGDPWIVVARIEPADAYVVGSGITRVFQCRKFYTAGGSTFSIEVSVPVQRRIELNTEGKDEAP
jgi:hypothetical protein